MTCPDCGNEMAGQQCAVCGTHAGEEHLTNTAATGVAARPEANEPYAGYHSVGPAAGVAGAGYVTSGTTGSQPQSSPSGINTVLATLTGVAAIAVLALVAYLFLRPVNGADGQAAPSASARNSTSASMSPSPSPSTSTTTSETSTMSSTATAEPAPQTTPASPETSSSSPTTSEAASTSPASTPADAKSQLQTATEGADELHKADHYVSVRRGSTVELYDTDTASLLTAFTVSGSTYDSALVMLTGCSRPTYVHNTNAGTGSALFGWDGSGYQAYKANGDSSGSLYPNGGDGSGNSTYGVNIWGSGVEVRDSGEKNKTRGSGHHFSSCSSPSPDVLALDKN